MGGRWQESSMRPWLCVLCCWLAHGCVACWLCGACSAALTHHTVHQVPCQHDACSQRGTQLHPLGPVQACPGTPRGQQLVKGLASLHADSQRAQVVDLQLQGVRHQGGLAPDAEQGSRFDLSSKLSTNSSSDRQAKSDLS